MLDVRPLFSTPASGHPGLRKAQGEKPKRPLHVLSTGERPLVRFIGHLDMAINEGYFEAWIPRLALWIKQGKTPWLMVHTPDNRQDRKSTRLNSSHVRISYAVFCLKKKKKIKKTMKHCYKNYTVHIYQYTDNA